MSSIKKWLTILIVIAIVLLGALVIDITVEDQRKEGVFVPFVDENFENAVRELINKPKGKIKDKDVEDITSLKLKMRKDDSGDLFLICQALNILPHWKS